MSNTSTNKQTANLRLSTLFIFMFAFSFSPATAQTAPLKQWDARFGGSSDDYFSSLAETTDGGYILGGYSYSGTSGDKTQASQGLGDYWIVKTDAYGVMEWDARFGGSSGDYPYALKETTDGGYILGGHSDSGISGDKTQTTQGGFDYWIVKTDANGIKQWDARFGGSDFEVLTSLDQTNDGGYILGGYSLSGISGDKTQASQGNVDYWIVKTDANGFKQWDARFGGSSEDYLFALSQTNDGGYILGGYSLSGISGDKTQTNQGLADYWIIKTDANGLKLWEARFGGNGYDYLISLKQTADGGYILGGASNSGINGDKTQASQGLYDYWIVKTDATGAKQWDARFGGNSSETLYSLEQAAEGGYILGGYSYSGISGDKTQASQGMYDYWIVKTDANGMKQWDTRFGGSAHDYLTSLAQTADGAYILGGYSGSGISGDKTQASQGGNDYWIVKVASDCIGDFTVYADADDDGFGNIANTLIVSDCIVPAGYVTDSGDCNDDPDQSGASIHPGATEIFNGIDDDCNGIVDDALCPTPSDLSVVDIRATSTRLTWDAVSGAISYKIYYQATASSAWNVTYSPENVKTLFGLIPNTQYYWNVKAICSISPPIKSDRSAQSTFTTGSFRTAESLEQISFQIYPNPAEEQTTITFSLTESSHLCVKMYDVNGREIKTLMNDELQSGTHSIQLNTSHFSKGVYLVKIISDEGIENQKLVVQ